MTVDEVRGKAVKMLRSRADGGRLPESIVQLHDGESFSGVLMERAVREDHFGMKERLGFTTKFDSVRYCAIESIASF